MPAPQQQDDESVVSGRPPSPWLGYAVLGVLLLATGVAGSWLAGAPWPLPVAAALLAIMAAPAVLAQWRYRHDFAALRRARRRIADTYDNPHELVGMVGTSPAALRQLVHARCQVADRDGVTLFIELEEEDEMAQAWLDEGFGAVEHVDTTWGRFTLLVRPARS